MIRRPAVVRSNSIISARPVGRSSGAKIFCDINPDGNYGIDTIHIEACQFELLVDANYGRTFFSATVSHLRAYDEGSGLEWGTAAPGDPGWRLGRHPLGVRADPLRWRLIPDRQRHRRT